MIKLDSPLLIFSEKQLSRLKKHLLNWASSYPFVCALDNCEHEVDRYGSYEYLLGIGGEDVVRFQNWKELYEYKGSWLMGIMPYELKDQLEKHISTSHEADIRFPAIPLFQPQLVLGIKRGSLELEVLHNEEKIPLESLRQLLLELDSPLPSDERKIWTFEAHVSRRSYIETIHKLQEHIKEGDTYEVNLAQAFLANGKLTYPSYWFHRLIEISPVPFAAFLKWEDQYLLCASPERFLQSKHGILRTQPIKGTAPRSEDPEEDASHYQYLSSSHKEQAENVMIVDLSRNDLYKSSIPHTVHVPHLFEIQAFPQVYQMVSTVEGQLLPKLRWQEVVANTFPPGSMTGAPKVRTMQLIDKYEPVSRGIYAGSVGYVTPSGDFDWNVIIRSLIYDDARELLSYHVGGAITYDSDPEREYEETLLKAEALRRVFG